MNDFLNFILYNKDILISEYGHSHHGHGHSHSHNTKHSTINTLVATDDNENDERFTPPPPPILSVDHEMKPKSKASQMNMRGVFLHILSDALGKGFRSSIFYNIHYIM